MQQTTAQSKGSKMAEYKWGIDGILAGKRYHKTLKTRNWDAGHQKVVKLEAEVKAEPDRKTMKAATEDFIHDAEVRQLRPPSIYKYQLLFKTVKRVRRSRRPKVSSRMRHSNPSEISAVLDEQEFQRAQEARSPQNILPICPRFGMVADQSSQTNQATENR